jgi:prevent-host-death family protein
MMSLSPQEASNHLENLLLQVQKGQDSIAIQSPGQEPVYLISSQDFELLQKLVQYLEDQRDVAEADARLADENIERIDFETLFQMIENTQR